MVNDYYLVGTAGVDVSIFPSILPSANKNIPWYLTNTAEIIPNDRMPQIKERQFIIEKDADIDRKEIELGDRLTSSDSLNIFSEKALNIFKQKLDLGEYDKYEITVNTDKTIVKKYFLVNFKNLVAIDEDKSKLRKYSDNTIATVSELVFDNKALSDAPDFVKSKILPYELYASNKVVEVVLDHKLLNFSFVGPYNGETYSPNNVIQFPKKNPDGTLDDLSPSINLIN